MSTILTDDRDTALRVGYVATDWTNALDFQAYEAAMGDWTIRAVVRDGECIGAAYRQGDEIHVSILPQYRKRWATRSILRQLFSGNRVTTRVVPGHDYMYDILARLGFVQMPDGLFVKGH